MFYFCLFLSFCPSLTFPFAIPSFLPLSYWTHFKNSSIHSIQENTLPWFLQSEKMQFWRVFWRILQKNAGMQIQTCKFRLFRKCFLQCPWKPPGLPTIAFTAFTLIFPQILQSPQDGFQGATGISQFQSWGLIHFSTGIIGHTNAFQTIFIYMQSMQKYTVFRIRTCVRNTKTWFGPLNTFQSIPLCLNKFQKTLIWASWCNFNPFHQSLNYFHPLPGHQMLFRHNLIIVLSP